jgi:UDP-N-acetylmuramoyl-tripeptide--D-alanyl-D-alanine ligase
MIEATLGEIARIIGGRLDGVTADAAHAVTVTGPVVIDSRDATAGSLFAALVGGRSDGHDFTAEASARGAVASVVDRAVGSPAVVVPDVTGALGALADWNARHLAAENSTTIIGITGSSGKTSTKDLLAQVLESLGSTVAPPGSFNNEIGLPLTVLSADRSTRHLVLEMGARGVGHIATLCSIAHPAIGVVLNVGSAHLGEFGSRQAIGAAKAELVEALPATGLAVLNADDPVVAAMADRTVARVVTVGITPLSPPSSRAADIRAADIKLDEHARPGFSLITPEGTAPVQLRVVGRHQVANALSVAAVVRELGCNPRETADRLSAAQPLSRWRMEVTQRNDGLLVINDSYNANPESMQAALEAVQMLAAGRRVWALLGEMKELGAMSVFEHRRLGESLVGFGVNQLMVVGEAARPILTAAIDSGFSPESAIWVPTAATAAVELSARLRPTDVVVVKASRAVGLERVAAALIAGREPTEPKFNGVKKGFVS